MADAPKIGIESVIHEAVTKALQNIADEFGIRVTSVRASWLDETKVVNDIFTDCFTVSGLEVVSETGCVRVKPIIPQPQPIRRDK